MGRLPLPETLAESAYWPQARDILHFVGICGAGKTTLANRLGRRCASHGGKVIGTIDWCPHTPDVERASERAFSRELDRLNNASGANSSVHQQIMGHSLALIESWKASDANLVLVDRWYESYDHLPRACVEEIEAAIEGSGFLFRHVLLLVEGGPNFTPPSPGRDVDSIRQRLIHTKAHRPDTWWATGPTSLDAWVQEEYAYQDSYRQFCKKSRFKTFSLNTREMFWDHDEMLIVSDLLDVRWLKAFRELQTSEAVGVEA